MNRTHTPTLKFDELSSVFVGRWHNGTSCHIVQCPHVLSFVALVERLNNIVS